MLPPLLSPDNPAGRNADSLAFVEALKDGVLLCRAVDSLRPGVVKYFVRQPISLLFERQNIECFLVAARELGVPESELFAPHDLISSTNYQKVAITLCALARITHDSRNLSITSPITEKAMDSLFSQSSPKQRSVGSYHFLATLSSITFNDNRPVPSHAIHNAVPTASQTSTTKPSHSRSRTHSYSWGKDRFNNSLSVKSYVSSSSMPNLAAGDIIDNLGELPAYDSTVTTSTRKSRPHILNKMYASSYLPQRQSQSASPPSTSTSFSLISPVTSQSNCTYPAFREERALQTESLHRQSSLSPSNSHNPLHSSLTTPTSLKNLFHLNHVALPVSPTNKVFQSQLTTLHPTPLLPSPSSSAKTTAPESASAAYLSTPLLPSPLSESIPPAILPLSPPILYTSPTSFNASPESSVGSPTPSSLRLSPTTYVTSSIMPSSLIDSTTSNVKPSSESTKKLQHHSSLRQSERQFKEAGENQKVLEELDSKGRNARRKSRLVVPLNGEKSSIHPHISSTSVLTNDADTTQSSQSTKIALIEASSADDISQRTRGRKKTLSVSGFVGNLLERQLSDPENDSDVTGLREQYLIGNCIGKGNFGAVYKAINMETGHTVAVKRIIMDEGKTDVASLMSEVNLLKKLDHPNIVQYLSYIKSVGEFNIILEYVENGSLLHTLKSFGPLPERYVVKVVDKVLDGLDYLHAQGMMHLDLKAANILTTKTMEVKLSDFGVSLAIKASYTESERFVGTAYWMAPEIIELEGPTTASDIWSLGCTIVELLTGQPPYGELLALSAMFRIVEDGAPPLPEDSGISDDCKDFLAACFHRDPRLRPSARQLSMYSWMCMLRSRTPLPFEPSGLHNSRAYSPTSPIIGLTTTLLTGSNPGSEDTVPHIIAPRPKRSAPPLPLPLGTLTSQSTTSMLVSSPTSVASPIPLSEQHTLGSPITAGSRFTKPSTSLVPPVTHSLSQSDQTISTISYIQAKNVHHLSPEYSSIPLSPLSPVSIALTTALDLASPSSTRSAPIERTYNLGATSADANLHSPSTASSDDRIRVDHMYIKIKFKDRAVICKSCSETQKKQAYLCPPCGTQLCKPCYSHDTSRCSVHRSLLTKMTPDGSDFRGKSRMKSAMKSWHDMSILSSSSTSVPVVSTSPLSSSPSAMTAATTQAPAPLSPTSPAQIVDRRASYSNAIISEKPIHLNNRELSSILNYDERLPNRSRMLHRRASTTLASSPQLSGLSSSPPGTIESLSTSTVNKANNNGHSKGHIEGRRGSKDDCLIM